MRPLILIPSDLDADSSPPKDVLSSLYGEAVSRAGGTPLLAGAWGLECLSHLLEVVDGVLLPGGRDYRRAGRHATARYCAPAREKRDFLVWSLLEGSQHPVLGICLGMQLMVLGTGGFLYPDIASCLRRPLSHVRGHHWVRVEPESRLGHLLGGRLKVNSSHHQAVRRVGRGLRAVAWAGDGVVEAVEGGGARFLVGVQWHPERMVRSPVQRRLFGALVESARRGGTWW